MGAESTSSSGGGIDRNDRRYDTPVVLNVYDLTPMNNYSVWFGLGIFHSGIEVHGKEYGFGAHDFPVSGVFEVEPKACPGFIYRCSISLGRINMSPTEFRTFIENVAAEYHGDTYHLISKNCNHFTDDIACRLTERRIPGWVNRLARLEEDGTESLTITTPRVSTEVDDDQERRLLSPLAAVSPMSGCGDVTFVKEAHT
ncbi:PREDICTED: deSI-like protein At4g17486-like isoform 2 [Fragaria vesca subsp. vesca]